jgi:hypothetical protein
MKLQEEKCRYQEDLTTASRCPWAFWSCFRDSDDFGSVDEVTKPLYYIVDEVSSQQVRDFCQESKAPKGWNERRHHSNDQSSPSSSLRLKISNLLHRGSRRRRDSETASITRVESAIILNGVVGNRNSIFRSSRPNPFGKLSLKPVRRTIMKLGKKLKSMKVPNPLCYSNDKTNLRSGYAGFEESFDSSVEPDEQGPPVVLGVTFSHPVFVGNVDEESNKTFSPSRSAWGKYDSETKLAKSLNCTTADTKTSGSWGSYGSFPSDECEDSYRERKDGDFEYNFCDFEDLPFDEATTSNVAAKMAVEYISRRDGNVEVMELYSNGYFFPSYDDDDDTFGDGSLSWVDRYDTDGKSETGIQSLNTHNTLRGTRFY